MADFLVTGLPEAEFLVTEFSAVGFREPGFPVDETEAWFHFNYHGTGNLILRDFQIFPETKIHHNFFLFFLWCKRSSFLIRELNYN